MTTGYSRQLANKVNCADKKLLGVKLGLLCLDKDVPVKQIAESFGVSRMTVYFWFYGGKVTTRHFEKMKKLITELS